MHHSTYSCIRSRECVVCTTVLDPVPEGGNVYHNTYSCTRRRKCVPQYLLLYLKEEMCTTVPSPVSEVD